VNRAIVILVCAIAFAPIVRCQTTKKLIEFGWDEPDTAFMQKHIAEMEQTPFDGTVFHITYEKKDGSPGRFMNECWSDRAFTPGELKRSAGELKQTTFTRFTQNFIRFNVLPGDVDWFDDFDAVMNNAYFAARIARDGKCRGVLFDIEAYNKPLWDYRKQKYAATHSWDEYAERARMYGRLLMSVFEDGFGDNVVVFLTFGHSLPYRDTHDEPKKLAEYEYGLLKPFLDGMYDATRGDAKIVDGYELSYGSREGKQFADAEQMVRQTLLKFVPDPDRYQRATSLGFGLWLDYDWAKKGWDVSDLSKNYFTPKQFEESLRIALKTADEFVWIYSETPRWWSENGRVKLPDEYIRAIARAREK
jgi:hypothetical protein